MIPQRIAAFVARSCWKAALLGLLTLGFVLLPSPAEGHSYQPYDTIIVLTGSGSTLTSRVQIGSRCFTGQTAQVFTQVNGGTVFEGIAGNALCTISTPGAAICTASIFGAAICTPPIPSIPIQYQITFSQCVSTGGATTTCPPSTGIQSNAGTAECGYYAFALPTTTWQVTCIFRH